MTRFLCLLSLVLAVSLGAVPVLAEQPGATPPASSAVTGRDGFYFKDWGGPDVPVWLYIPAGVDRRKAPIVIVMHGVNRDPDRYREDWVQEAEKRGFIIVAPGFSQADFPKADGYNLGAMRDADTGAWRDRSLWSYSVIEPIFDAVVMRIGGSQRDYTLYGRSAGSQFVHRSLFFAPGPRAKRYLAANAGWYTFPDLGTAFPFGLGDTMLTEDDVSAALAKDVVILLGDKDDNPNSSSLNKSREARKQGAHRFARGQAFFAAARDLAAAKGWQFGWSLRVVKGVAHSNSGMAPNVSDLIE